MDSMAELQLLEQRAGELNTLKIQYETTLIHLRAQKNELIEELQKFEVTYEELPATIAKLQLELEQVITQLSTQIPAIPVV